MPPVEALERVDWGRSPVARDDRRDVARISSDSAVGNLTGAACSSLMRCGGVTKAVDMGEARDSSADGRGASTTTSRLVSMVRSRAGEVVVAGVAGGCSRSSDFGGCCGEALALCSLCPSRLLLSPEVPRTDSALSLARSATCGGSDGTSEEAILMLVVAARLRGR